ncbi:MAG: hypothetical protein K9K35_15015 [Rhodoferax sp.]|nr:hypothetical protein [Rhodoferax sp.]
MVKTLRKLPDGAVWQRKPDGTVAVEWVEQEAAAKAMKELERCLRAAEYVGQALDVDKKYCLAGLVFVFDQELNHARRILLAANSRWGHLSQSERAALERRVTLVAVELRDPLVWAHHSVTTLHEYRQRRV